jgi:ADP-ribose pyrophosphatase YjhB (NUDIX family)
VEVCLIRRKDSKKWAIPKGFIDRGDTPEEAALNEAFEEAGLDGKIIGGAIGTYDYKKEKTRLSVAVYLMKVLEEHEKWPEMTFRQRGWRSLNDAAGLLESHPIAPLWARITERVAALRRVKRGDIAKRGTTRRKIL